MSSKSHLPQRLFYIQIKVVASMRNAAQHSYTHPSASLDPKTRSIRGSIEPDAQVSQRPNRRACAPVPKQTRSSHRVLLHCVVVQMQQAILKTRACTAIITIVSYNSEYAGLCNAIPTSTTPENLPVPPGI